MRHLFHSIVFLLPTAALFAVAPAVQAQGGSQGAQNPFSAPDATIHHAPERMYDLQNLVLDLNVDYPDRLLTATATNTLVPIKAGVTQLRFHAGHDTKIDSVELNGKTAAFKRDDEGILVDCPPTKIPEKDVVSVHYHVRKSEQTHGENGWHWHEPKKNDPAKIGFWTNGEYDDTRQWAVTWDYPNDFTTTETRTTVPADWQVIGNGHPVSDRPSADGKTHTVVWRMTQPHATYLTSVVAGPFDIKKDVWQGVPLYYVVPRGKGHYIDYTFANTKDMLSFYSKNLGVKYPWPKYAMDCTYDFGGGQENVSATTFGLFMTDPRDGYFNMDSLLSHELGHQWFGDYVTCTDWGQIWLNESFATFMEMSYTAHSEGINSAMREIEQNSQGYFQESRRYKRPMVTNLYQDPGVMFDQHTYPKGGVLLTSLRKEIGDKAFFDGLHRYLTTHHNMPVETQYLREDLSAAAGKDLKPWFDQWIYKPGHPVIDWSWKWDAAKNEAVVHVAQTQDTAAGTPIYDVPTHVALLSEAGPNHISRAAIHLNAKDQEFRIRAGVKPDAVVFDPDHDFLREIPKRPWADTELPTVAKFDPNCVDRQFAFNKMLASPSDSVVQTAIAILKADTGRFPAIQNTSTLAHLSKPELRGFFESELKHESFERRNWAVIALSELPSDPVENERLRGLINDQEPYRVVAGAITALGKFDYAGTHDLFVQQARTSENAQIRGAALGLLMKNNAPEATDIMFASLEENQPDAVQQAGITALASFKGDDPRIVPALRSALNSGSFGSVFPAIDVARRRKVKELVPDLQALGAKSRFIKPQTDAAIKEIQG